MDRKEVKDVLRHKGFWVIVVILIILFGIIIYLNFFYKTECKTIGCFKEAMSSCNKISYVNEEPEASWLYTISGNTGNECKVNVKLVLAKQGELGVDRLIGYDMDCYYPKGVSAYPEKDLAKCHGRLKEELQNVVIKKLYTYILEKIGQIDKELNEAI